jgi:lysophospholipase L1-like esterase
MPEATLEALKDAEPSSRLTGQKLEWMTVNAGVGGEPAEGGKSRIGALVDIERPDIVTVCYGGNDMHQRHDPDRFRKNMVGIIEIVQSHAKAPRVVLMTTTPMDASRHFLGKEKYVLDQGGLDYFLDSQYNGMTRQVAEQRGLPLVDLHRYFNKDKDPMKYLIDDGVHLSAAGNRFAGTYIAKCLLAWYEADVLKDADAIKLRESALKELGRLKASTMDPNERKTHLAALDEIWHACPFLAETGVMWHEMTYPAAVK